MLAAAHCAEALQVSSGPRYRKVPSNCSQAADGLGFEGRPQAHAGGTAVTVTVSAPADEAAVITHEMPPLGKDKAYKLWLISDADVKPAGGSPQPTTDPIMVQKL
ncbi:anti-sigma factor domain-containing protein [Arthrobacter sp. GCM10027362]|uniref:anti-sigma factor domain-containing protein n=1 Tax=Arthrobacter sp. GCM10027362 TaxID=3273379 RepID=UPI00362F6975